MYYLAQIIYVLGTCFGLPLTVSDTVLSVGDTSYIVALECLGYRSLISLFTVAIAYIFLTKKTRHWFTMIFSAIGLAVVGNICRIMSVLTACHFYGSAVADIVHTLSGYIVYLIAILILFRIGDKLKGG